MARARALASEVKAAFAERPREIAALLVLAALTIASYGFSRPAIESLYVERYGANKLPWAWLGVGIAALATTILYNRVIAAAPLRRLWPRVVVFVAAIGGAAMAAVWLEVPHAEYVAFLWKDIYIVVLVELFWSIANVSFPLARAKWLYGAFLAAGSLGGLAAELLVGEVADSIGSVAAATMSLPVLLVVAAMTPFLPAAARAARKSTGINIAAVAGRAVTVLRKSRYLVLLVGLVALVQISLTVIDYQFNIALESYEPNVDERTKLGGQLFAVISAASLVLQVLAGLIVRGLGIPVTIALAPVLLLAGSLAFAVHPRFGVIALVKVASKALDYSLGRAAKELLYIPLTYEEKTEGKAVVDLLAYRVAKAVASAMLLWLIAGAFGASTITALVLALLVAWLVLAIVTGRRFAAGSSRDRGKHGP